MGRSTSEPKDETDTYIRLLAEELNNPQFKVALKKYLAKHDYPLFYSKTADGTEIVCIPGMSNKYQINDLYDSDIVVATYPINHLLNNNKLYKHHIIATGDRELNSHGPTLEEEVLNLVEKVNDLYDTLSVRDIINSQIGGEITFTKRALSKRIEAFDRFFTGVDTKAKIREDKYKGTTVDPFQRMEDINEMFGIKFTIKNPHSYL